MRRGQNWIGNKQVKVNYVPPIPEQVNLLVENFLQFINDECFSPALRAYVAHSQLVLIHPFNDGNGRTARVLWDTLIEKTGVQSINPMIYRLACPDSNYIDALRAFGKDNDLGMDHEFWQSSIKWGENYKKTANEIIDTAANKLRSKTILSVFSKNENTLQNYLWQQPVVHISGLNQVFGWNTNVSLDAISALANKGILLPRKVKYPVGEIVYECPEILNAWLELENAIFAENTI